MGQKDLRRTQFDAKEAITSSLDSTRQELAFTWFYKDGDTVDIVALDAQGCVVGSPLAENLTIQAIDTNVAVYLSASVDTSTALPTGGVAWYLSVNDIDDGQEAIDRLYRCFNPSAAGAVSVCADVADPDDVRLDSPVGGQSTHLVTDIKLLRAGDEVQVLADSGLLGTANIVSLDARADDSNNESQVVLDSNIDTTGETNVRICTTSLTTEALINRINENVDKIDAPIENEDLDACNGLDTAFETDNLFLQGTSKGWLDGGRMRLGTAGTRASLTQDGLTYTSMLLGLLGNEVEVSIASGAGFTIVVDKQFKANPNGINTGDTYYRITINDNGGAATEKEIADALNADAEVRRLVQVQYAGDGSATASTFALTNLAGGLDDGTGDYAEIEQIFENSIVATGYKWLSLHIRPDEDNRYSTPPAVSEEAWVDYRKALTNA
jgi:hypothetical protein